jgi:hypothetical protein
MEDAPRSKCFQECRVVGIIWQFWLLFGIQVIEIAKEFLESVHGWQIFIAVTEVVLSELTGGVTERLEQFGDGRVFRL